MTFCEKLYLSSIYFKSNFKLIKIICRENVYLFGHEEKWCCELLLFFNFFLLQEFFSYCENFSQAVRIFLLLPKFFLLLWEFFTCCENFSPASRIISCCENFSRFFEFFSCFKNFLLCEFCFCRENFSPAVRFFFLLWEFSSVARVLSPVMIIFLWWTKVTL